MSCEYANSAHIEMQILSLSFLECALHNEKHVNNVLSYVKDTFRYLFSVFHKKFVTYDGCISNKNSQLCLAFKTGALHYTGGSRF